jgi:hypothetical protein
MRGSRHADGEPLVYWRCEACRAIFSRLSQPRGVYGAMCRDPAICEGKGYCPREIACND